MYSESSSRSRCGYNYPAAQEYYFLAQANETFSAESYSGSFDLLVYTNNTELNDTWPEPSNDALNGNVILGKTNNDPVTVTITFKGTGDSRDTYSYWTYSGTIPAGYHKYTACGVQLFMTQLTSDQYNVTTSGNEYTLNIGSLSRTAEAHFAVVVSRTGGYMATYQPLALNGGSVVSVNMILLILCMLGLLIRF